MQNFGKEGRKLLLLLSTRVDRKDSFFILERERKGGDEMEERERGREGGDEMREEEK